MLRRFLVGPALATLALTPAILCLPRAVAADEPPPAVGVTPEKLAPEPSAPAAPAAPVVPSAPAEPTAPAVPQVVTAPIEGRVLQRGDRTPIAGALVLLDDGALETASDAEGRFAFPAVPVGEHALHLRGGVVLDADTTVTVAANQRTVLTLYALRRERYRSVVRGQRLTQETVMQSLSVEEVRRIPGTQGDTVKAVQNLPGVARPPFNGGLLVVWGSAPSDTRTYVDGVYIPILFHYSGLRSTVNSEIVRSLGFMPGGFGVEHGRGLGGAIEIESRRPRKDGYHGFAQIDLIDISAMLEGPIGGRGSFAAGARVSWLHLFLPLFITSDVQAAPLYWDYQARLHLNISARDDLDLFVFGSDDKLDLILRNVDPKFELTFDHHVYFHRALARWTHRFGGGATFSVTAAGGYDQPFNLKQGLGALPFQSASGQLGWTLRALARVPLSRFLRLDAGLDYEGTRFSLDAAQNVTGMLREGDNGGFGGLGGSDASVAVARDRMFLYTNHVAPFVTLDFNFLDGRLGITPQLRLELMTFRGYPGESREFQRYAFLPEPRLAARFGVHPRISLRGAVGVYHQPPDSPDLSSVFGSTRLRPMFGVHYVAGIEVQAATGLRVEVQGFYKELRDLVMRGAAPGGDPLVNSGDGRVYGGELLVRQELWRNFFGWISYTISKSERRDRPGAAWRPFQYDQTHILTLVASYKLPWGLQAGVRFRYVTGNPYTPAARSYFDSNSDSYMPLWGAPYSARMPSFHQLDVRVDKTFTFDRWKLVLYLDIQNVYYARSAEAASFNYDFSRLAFVSGLPLLPALGVRGEF